MVDTLVLKGPVDNFRQSWDYSLFQGYKRRGKVEKVTKVMVKDSPEYRAWYYPGSEYIKVEFSLPKLIFGTNSVNYATNQNLLNRLVGCAGNSFFTGGSYFVARCDLGYINYYPDYATASAVVDTFRNTRLPGARKNSYKHQNYPDSVFYKSANWSIKIYNKGLEQKIKPHMKNAYLLGALRVEKTYRFREMERLGMTVAKTLGVPISVFRPWALYDDFQGVINSWCRQLPNRINGLSGALGLLSVIDQAGLLSEVEANGITSRSTLHRYKKVKAEYQPALDFPFASTEQDVNFSGQHYMQLQNFLNFGLHLKN